MKRQTKNLSIVDLNFRGSHDLGEGYAGEKVVHIYNSIQWLFFSIEKYVECFTCNPLRVAGIVTAAKRRRSTQIYYVSVLEQRSQMILLASLH